LAQADHHEPLRRYRAFRRREENRLAELADELAAVTQRRQDPREMLVGVFGSALVRVARGLVLQETDDLEIRRLSVGADHLDRYPHPERLRIEDVLLRCWRRRGRDRTESE